MAETLATHSPFLTKLGYSVSHEGGLVRLNIGNVALQMDYEGALELAAFLHMHGKEAKRNAGDTSRRWTVMGMLEDVEARERRLQANRWA